MPNYSQKRFYWTKKTKRIFELLKEGKPPEEIAEILKCQEERVLEIITHPTFVSRFNRDQGLFLIYSQMRRFQILAKLLELLWQKVKKGIDEIPPAVVLRQLKGLLQIPGDVNLIKSQQLNVFKIEKKKKSPLELEKAFGYERLNR